MIQDSKIIDRLVLGLIPMTKCPLCWKELKRFISHDIEILYDEL